jgi:hypothetical protein
VAVLDAESAPAIPLIAIALTVLLLIEAIITHWRFRTGRSIPSRLGPDTPWRGLLISLGYSALPSALASGSMTGMFAAMRLSGGSPNTFVTYLVLVLGASFLFCAGWAIKEFYRPSSRRTPGWLKSQA